jgi:hypothetical protein
MHVISGKLVAQLNMWRPRGPSLLQSRYQVDITAYQFETASNYLMA